jgi:hypothetical protein
LAFLSTLEQLKSGLGFFGYYCKFVYDYAYVAKPFYKCKTRGFKGALIKGKGKTKASYLNLLWLDQVSEKVCYKA